MTRQNTTAHSLSATAVSAPGKVLLAGGYLVLDREYTGLVFALNARIHVHIRPLMVPGSGAGISLEEIIVKSPQFRNAVWEYGYRLTENGGGIQLFQLRSSAQETIRPNPFVETTISYVLSYISTLVSSPIESASITILADDDYYTQPNMDNVTEFKGQRFKDFGVSLADAHKTGLGSSAALVTALTAALLSHYLTPDLFSMQTDEGKARLHNLAQTAHCAAQGKVGSGFDVASAVYGPCVYRRFSPTLLQHHGTPGSPQFANRLKTLVNDSDPANKWDTEVAKSAVKVPRGIRLVMCDVDCGSQTPGMVKQLLAWRAKEPEEAGMLWQQLHSKNQALAAELKRLAEVGGVQVQDEYGGLSKCFADMRRLIRDMSRLSGVPVEPEEQTKLLDACSAIEGVIGGVVPGAGGFDAIVLLVRDEKEAFDNLRGRLKEWNQAQSQNATETSAVGRVSLLRVREEMEGVRSEDAASGSDYKSWLG